MRKCSDSYRIYDAAVIGVQFNKNDESEFPRAYIVKRDNDEGKKLDSKAVFNFMAEKLAKFKRPDGGVVFVDEIVSWYAHVQKRFLLTVPQPKNPSGKILKKNLREQAAEEMKKERQTSKL